MSDAAPDKKRRRDDDEPVEAAIKKKKLTFEQLSSEDVPAAFSLDNDELKSVTLTLFYGEAVALLPALLLVKGEEPILQAMLRNLLVNLLPRYTKKRQEEGKLKNTVPWLSATFHANGSIAAKCTRGEVTFPDELREKIRRIIVPFITEEDAYVKRLLIIDLRAKAGNAQQFDYIFTIEDVSAHLPLPNKTDDSVLRKGYSVLEEKAFRAFIGSKKIDAFLGAIQKGTGLKAIYNYLSKQKFAEMDPMQQALACVCGLVSGNGLPVTGVPGLLTADARRHELGTEVGTMIQRQQQFVPPTDVGNMADLEDDGEEAPLVQQVWTELKELTSAEAATFDNFPALQADENAKKQLSFMFALLSSLEGYAPYFYASGEKSSLFVVATNLAAGKHDTCKALVETMTGAAVTDASIETHGIKELSGFFCGSIRGRLQGTLPMGLIEVTGDSMGKARNLKSRLAALLLKFNPA